jgi:hypothetical protein
LYILNRAQAAAQIIAVFPNWNKQRNNTYHSCCLPECVTSCAVLLPSSRVHSLLGSSLLHPICESSLPLYERTHPNEPQVRRAPWGNHAMNSYSGAIRHDERFRMFSCFPVLEQMLVIEIRRSDWGILSCRAAANPFWGVGINQNLRCRTTGAEIIS